MKGVGGGSGFRDKGSGFMDEGSVRSNAASV